MQKNGVPSVCTQHDYLLCLIMSFATVTDKLGGL